MSRALEAPEGVRSFAETKTSRLPVSGSYLTMSLLRVPGSVRSSVVYPVPSASQWAGPKRAGRNSRCLKIRSKVNRPGSESWARRKEAGMTEPRIKIDMVRVDLNFTLSSLGFPLKDRIGDYLSQVNFGTQWRFLTIFCDFCLPISWDEFIIGPSRSGFLQSKKIFFSSFPSIE